MYILVGTHGTGKSTLLQELHKVRPEFYITDGFSRPVKNIKNHYNLSSQAEQFMINELTKWAFTNYVNHKNVFSTRSPIDAIIYSEHYQTGTDTTELKEVFNKYKDQIDGVFYIPIEFDIVDDGTRYLDVEDQKAIDKKILEFLKTERIHFHTITGTVEGRVKQVLSLI